MSHGLPTETSGHIVLNLRRLNIQRACQSHRSKTTTYPFSEKMRFLLNIRATKISLV